MLPNDREKILKNWWQKIWTHCKLSPNTDQELNFNQFYTHPHPQYIRFWNLQLLRTCGIKLLIVTWTQRFNKDRCCVYSGCAKFVLNYFCCLLRQLLRSDTLLGMIWIQTMLCFDSVLKLSQTNHYSTIASMQGVEIICFLYLIKAVQLMKRWSKKKIKPERCPVHFRYFFMFCISSADFDFFKINFFKIIVWHKRLGPDQDRCSVDPDLGPNCLQRLLADDKSPLAREELKQRLFVRSSVDLIRMLIVILL